MIKGLHITRQRARIINALVLIVIALLIFLYALFLIKIPETSLPVEIEVTRVFKDGTPASFFLIMNFSTVGCFSAENPIHVKVVLSNANISNIADYVGAITFSFAYNVNQSSNFVGNFPLLGYLTFHQGDNNTYTAEGDLIWHESATCYVIIVPPFQGMLSGPKTQWEGAGDPVLYVSSVSDTLAFRSNQTMEQLTYVLVGFSVIMLQPVLDGVISKEDSKALEEYLKDIQRLLQNIREEQRARAVFSKQKEKRSHEE